MGVIIGRYVVGVQIDLIGSNKGRFYGNNYRAFKSKFVFKTKGCKMAGFSKAYWDLSFYQPRTVNVRCIHKYSPK